MEVKPMLEELEKRIAVLRKAAALASDLKSLKEEVEALISRLLNLESYFDQTEQNKQDIIAINSSLSSALNRITTLENSLSTTQDSLEDAENEITLINTMINNIHTELDLHDDQFTTVNTELDDLDNTLTTLSSTVGSISTQISGINTDIEAIEGSMITLESAQDVLETQMGNLQTTVQGYSSSIQGLDTRLTTAESDIDANTNSISLITNNISTIQTNISNMLQDISTLDTLTDNIALQISTINLQLGGIDDDIAAVETNISTLQSSVSTLNTNMDTLESTVSTLSSTVSGYDTEIGTLETSLSTLSTTVSGHTTQLGTIEDSVEQNESDISGLNTRVTALENSGGTGGGDSGIIETFNMGAEENLILGTRDTNNNAVYIFFRCEPTAKIKVHLELNVHDFPVNEDSVKFSAYADDVLLKTFEFTENFTNPMTLPLDFEFFPKKKNYRLMIKAADVATQISVIESMFVKIDGRNIVILNRHHDLHMQVLDDTYYITIQTGNNASYLEQTTPDLTQTGTALTNLSGYGMLYRLYRHKRWQSGAYVTSNSRYVVVIAYGSEYKGGVLTLGSSAPTWRGEDIYDLYYTMRSGSTSYILSGTTLDGKAKIAIYSQFNSATASNYTITLNGQALEDKYVQCVPVYDNYLGSRTANTTIGFILLDNVGKLYYIPERTATYMIELGMGTQPNAYVQQDNKTIHVYFTHCGTTYKKTLTLNEDTNEFELSSTVQTFPGVTEYLEGINGTSLQKVDGEWQVVTNV